MMTEWEQVEHLLTKGYRPVTGADGWVTMAGPYAISHFHPDRWKVIQAMLDTPAHRRPVPMPPTPTHEEATAARNAALSRPARRPVPQPQEQAPRRAAAAAGGLF